MSTAMRRKWLASKAFRGSTFDWASRRHHLGAGHIGGLGLARSGSAHWAYFTPRSAT
jgi:hypothetical protein